MVDRETKEGKREGLKFQGAGKALSFRGVLCGCRDTMLKILN